MAMEIPQCRRCQSPSLCYGIDKVSLVIIIGEGDWYVTVKVSHEEVKVVA